MKTTEILRVTFGAAGGDAGMLGEGWGEPEAGYRWMLGARSDLALPPPPMPGEHVLLLAADPLVLGHLSPQQRLRIAVNGTSFDERTLSLPTVLVHRIAPAQLAGAAGIDVVLEHPDAISLDHLLASGDERMLSLNLSELALLRVETAALPPGRAAKRKPLPIDEPPESLLMRFASLGDNCEFGLFQRRQGAEPLDLFRLSGVPLPSLIQALEEGLSGLCDPAELSFEMHGEPGLREYILCHHRYHLQSHTTVMEGAMPIGRLFSREIKKLIVVARLLLDDLASGNRIFVVKRNTAIGTEEAMRLAALLRRYGPNTLLYIVPSTDRPAGSVEWVGDGLMRGHIDRFLDYLHADGAASDAWMTLCRNAYRLWREAIA
jgi:hypothetical protein